MTSRVLAELLAGWFLVVLVGVLLSCGARPDPQPVPGAQEAQALEVRLVDESTAAAEATATADVLEREADAPGQTSEQQTAKRADAERQRAAAERHRALSAELAQLRDAARIRAQAEQAELDRRADAAAKAADARMLNWVAGIAVALSAGAAGLLTWLGIPARIAWGIPGAVMISALTLSAWVAVGPWLALALGVVLALGTIAGLVVMVSVILREWHHAAASASEPGSAERDALNATSRARQPAWIRWMLDRILPLHAPTPGNT